MTDLVERLREKIITDAFTQGEITSGALAERLIRERLDASDEIERLRLELDMTQATIRVPSQKDDVRTIERLREELVSALDEAARLREAFGLISTLAPHMEVDVNDYIGMAQKICAENAKLREALNEQIVSQQQLRSLIAQYSQRYVRMQEALKPFAYYADQIPDDVSNTASASGTVGDLRAAKAALEGK